MTSFGIESVEDAVELSEVVIEVEFCSLSSTLGGTMKKENRTMIIQREERIDSAVGQLHLGKKFNAYPTAMV